MNRSQASGLVQETFTQAFDKNRFSKLTCELLNHLDESKAFARSSQYIKDAFRGHVRRFERLGTYTSPDSEKLDVLIVYLTHESKLERARTAIRNFVADHLKERNGKDAALVAFVSPSEAAWRFSYVKMEYASTQKDDGKVGMETRLTPARRFSYLVGEGESCHTAQTRFLDLLQDTQSDPGLADIEEAFSVEAVTNEFFKNYVALFDEVQRELDTLVGRDDAIRNEFQTKKVNTVDFAKKLMGQIVFLYFLQKKGWLGVQKGRDWGSGPRDFLRRLSNSEHGEYGNFFNDILEPLFYDTLATNRGDEAWCDHFQCRIPFLNGGLFEPLGNYDWRQTDIVLPNGLFANSEYVEEGITGTGILDVFDRYNFTVNEAEPLEKEVAIDPEMLGKVFENLIEENRRKGLGAYYTPREIVHYMCQQSLVCYLDTAANTSSVAVVPEKPGQGKLLGPQEPRQAALKASAHREVVPRQDLETFVRLGEQISHYESVDAKYAIKMPKSIQQHAQLIDERLAEITVCDPAVGSGAFPVGMMTEIVRARCALTPYLNDVRERTPYYFKRQAIQKCLYGVDIDPGAVEIAKLRLWLSLVVDEEDVKQVKPLPNLDYRIVCGNSLLGVKKDILNWRLFEELEALKPAHCEETDAQRKREYKERIDGLISQITNNDKDFNFAVYFSEVLRSKGGFDVVIANPPYVRQEQIKELKPSLQKHFSCYTGVADLYVYFYERGFQLLKENGVLTFISSNKYFRSGYGKKLRQFLSSKSTLHQLIDFGDAPVFEATAYPSIIVLSKRLPNSNQTRALTWKAGPPIEQFESQFRASSFWIAQKELTSDGWRLESPAVLRLLEKLRKGGKPLGEYVNGRFYYGIKTGLNEAFVVDRATRDRLVAEHPSSAEVLKPFLRGRDVKRWAVEFDDQYLIRIESSENRRHPWSGRSPEEAERIFAHTHPAIHARFEGFRENLMKRDDQGKYFWELRSCVYWQEFQQPKITYPDIYRHQTFALDDNAFYCGNTTYFIPTEERWLSGLLNSSTVEWFYSLVSNKVRGGYMRAFSDYMKQIPIPPPPNPNPIESLVGQILAAKATDPAADVSVLEHEVNQLVYRLYGLTSEEIAIIDSQDGVSEPTDGASEATDGVPPRSELGQGIRLVKSGILPLPLSWIESNGQPPRAGFTFHGYTLVITTEEDSQDWGGIRYGAGAATVTLPGRWFGQAERVTVVAVGKNLEVTRLKP